MKIILGRTQCSMLDCPNEGIVIDGEKEWSIGRNYQGAIVLRNSPAECHPEFMNGMFMSEFVQWINSRLQ